MVVLDSENPKNGGMIFLTWKSDYSLSWELQPKVILQALFAWLKIGVVGCDNCRIILMVESSSSEYPELGVIVWNQLEIEVMFKIIIVDAGVLNHGHLDLVFSEFQKW